MKTRPHILVCRTDRLGDVLLSLPSLKLLRESFPTAKIDFHCDDSLESVLSGFLQEQKIGFSHDEWKRSYDGVLFLYSEPRWEWQAFKKRIPVRVGMYSKPTSFFLLTSGLRQRRSLAEQNEAEYNLELTQLFVKQLGSKEQKESAPISLVPPQTLEREADSILSKMGLESGFAILHPGMGGSAGNLSVQRYTELIRWFRSKTKTPLVLSCGPAQSDQAIKHKLLSEFRELPVLEEVELPLLSAIFAKATYVLAPSTGPIHLAHLSGTATFGFYSPVRTHRPDRWAPWGGTAQAFAEAPDVDCPETRGCIESRCPLYPCMDAHPWERSLEQFLDRVEPSSQPR